jgi:hypothetical protein
MTDERSDSGYEENSREQGYEVRRAGRASFLQSSGGASYSSWKIDSSKSHNEKPASDLQTSDARAG